MSKSSDITEFQSKIISRDTTQSKIPLIIPYKTFRDAVHGDIHLCQLEVDIINTEEFQRLRRIRQLGLSYLIYPSLHHTRFEHSIGTLYMAQKMVDAINQNMVKGVTIDYPRDLLLIRVCALLHDYSNIPFGHTLEDEGALFDSQWKDEPRKEYFIGVDSTVGKILADVDTEFRGDVEEMLCVNYKDPDSPKYITKLEKPYIADIVGNTICADLLDYLKRDAYFSGIKATYDDRLLKYIYIPDKGEFKKRLVLRLWYKGIMRVDTISDALNLLRLRYSLGEKIYYHHTKMYVSSMIVSAISAEKQNNESNIINLLNTHGDDELLYNILHNNGVVESEYGKTEATVSKYIVNKIIKRRIYKPVRTENFAAERLDSTNWKIKKHILDCCRKRGGETKYLLERYIEDLCNIPFGSVSIYSPEDKMGLKIAEVIVEVDETRTSLDKLNEVFQGAVHVSYIHEQLENINKNWRNIWAFYVLIDRDIGFDDNNEKTTDFNNVNAVWDWIVSQIRQGNSIENLIKNPPSDEIIALMVKNKLKDEPEDMGPFLDQQVIIDQVKAISSRSDKRYSPPPLEVLKEIIRNSYEKEEIINREEKN